jgi:2-dehydropantoate 2-reductase
MNLANAVDALVSDIENSNALMGPARDEAEACFAAAGIDRVTDADDQERRSGVLATMPVPNTTLPLGVRRGGSTWQSFVRGATTTEVDWLNGEIVLLGRQHGVPTPINRLLCDVTAWAAANGVAPRSMTTEEILSRRRS